VTIDTLDFGFRKPADEWPFRPLLTGTLMGQNSGEITVKTFVTDANFAILDLADFFGPKGTAVRILIEAMERGLGGLWVGGHASVSNGVLHVRGNRSDAVVYGRRLDYDLDLGNAQVSVENTRMAGLFPSSRLIVIRQHGEDVEIVTPNGHGDILGAAIKSWAV
jgi:hypothetical protein